MQFTCCCAPSGCQQHTPRSLATGTATPNSKRLGLCHWLCNHPGSSMFFPSVRSVGISLKQCCTTVFPGYVYQLRLGWLIRAIENTRENRRMISTTRG
ncbi:hypothetical protein B0O80DRAFT_296607 [Mortierella sp. GBAus27b]|nr:hypothetical protein B0O80DRAFT_296607 [Mortierella sp. GBAus27b]